MNDTDDWFRVDQVAENGLMVTEAGYQSYVVVGAVETVVIDTGIGVGDLRGLVEDLVDNPVKVLLTHSHWDHIGNASQFDTVGIHPRERTASGHVKIDALSDEFVGRPAGFVEEWRDQGNELPDCFDPATYSVDPTKAEAIEPGDRFDLGNTELEVLAVPGHSPGQQAALDPDSGVLYGGDVVGGNGDLIAVFQHSNLESYADTIERLVDLRDVGEFDTLLTGHVRPYRGSDLDVLNDMLDGLREIIAGKVTPREVESPWGAARRYEFDGFGVLTDRVSTASG